MTYWVHLHVLQNCKYNFLAVELLIKQSNKHQMIIEFGYRSRYRNGSRFYDHSINEYYFSIEGMRFWRTSIGDMNRKKLIDLQIVTN